MKRKSCLVLAVLLALLTVLSSVGVLSVGAETASYTFKPAKNDIVLDGTVSEGEEWDTVEWTALHHVGGNGSARADFSARFKGMWKEVDGVKYVYFLLDITDPNPSTDTGWQGDAFFVGLVDGSHKYTPTRNLLSSGMGLELSNLSGSYSAVDTRAENQHWVAEGRFPVSGESFFFDILVQDETGSGTYVRYAWNNITQNNVAPVGVGVLGTDKQENTEIELVGEDELGRYHIYRALGDITLDGSAADDEAWNAVAWSSPFNCNRVNGSEPAQEGFTARMKLLWQKQDSDAYLYMLVDTNDATTAINQGSWLGDYFSFIIDENCDGTKELTTAAIYIPIRDGYTADRFEYAVSDRRASGKGYTIEARYRFKDAANCADSIMLDVLLQDDVAKKAGDQNYVRYSWKNMNDSGQALTGLGVISELPVFATKTIEGASVRIDTETPNKSGIRFRTTVDAAALAELTAAGAKVQTGTLLLPTETLTGKGITEFTKENLLSAGLAEGKDFYNIENTGNGWVTGQDGTFIGTLFGIKSFRRSFSAVGYVRVELSDGTTYTIYGGYTAECARSVAQVAQLALDDASAVYTDAQRAILENFISGGTQS